MDLSAVKNAYRAYAKYCDGNGRKGTSEYIDLRAAYQDAYAEALQAGVNEDTIASELGIE